jgi:hypothetical protein
MPRAEWSCLPTRQAKPPNAPQPGETVWDGTYSLPAEIRGTRVFASAYSCYGGENAPCMIKFLLWCILFVMCWPLALVALIVYPLVWIFLIPFRILGIAVGGVLELVAALITLPARMLRFGGRA